MTKIKLPKTGEIIKNEQVYRPFDIPATIYLAGAATIMVKNPPPKIKQKFSFSKYCNTQNNSDYRDLVCEISPLKIEIEF